MQHMHEAKDTRRRINVRYEDLINNGQHEVARLSEWAGVEMCFETAMGNTDIRSKHMTSKDSASSVERWRNELSSDVQAIFSKELGTELTNLGYSV